MPIIIHIMSNMMYSHDLFYPTNSPQLKDAQFTVT